MGLLELGVSAVTENLSFELNFSEHSLASRAAAS